MVSKGRNACFADITSKVTDAQLLWHYFGIKKVPSVINSPLRKDKHPSFGLFTNDGVHIGWKDFSTNESGSTLKLLKLYFNISDDALYYKLLHDFSNMSEKSMIDYSILHKEYIATRHDTKLSCRIRQWQQYDIDYWKSYGVELKWLKWCNVYPIDYKIVEKDGHKMIFKADKYAYAFYEFKENNVTVKIYQPYNTKGFKWQNSHDRSVLGLWSKMPPKGDKLCICSSVKDALCLMGNLLIPCICVQGEGYPISNTALNVLKQRFKHIYVCLDNDNTGLKDAIRDAKEYGLTNVVIPKEWGQKDISDCYKYYFTTKEDFINSFKKLFNMADELPNN